MQYSTTMTQVNGAWRETLIVSNDAQIEFPDPSTVRQTVGNEEWIYHTDGLFRAFEGDNKYTYWFLIRYKEVVPAYATKEEVAALQELVAAQEDPFAGLSPRERKLVEISAACQSAIHAGVELGGERFSLTTEDQINIQNLALQIQGGAESVLYHADGGLCEPFPAAKMLALAEAAVRHVTYHTTYCNHLNAWIRRADEANWRACGTA